MNLELSPPLRRFPEWPPDFNIPPIEQENFVYLEVGVSAGHRGHWPGLASIFLISGVWVSGVFKILGAPWEVALLYMGTPAFAIALFCLIGTVLTPSPLPLRVNRQTGELYYVHSRRLYKASWQDFRALIELAPTTLVTGAYILSFILHREGDQKPLKIDVGGGRSWEHALRHWEYFCMYMEGGTPVPILREVPEDQKSQIRRNWETPTSSLLGRHADFMLSPGTWLNSKLEKLSLRPNRWPKEVIAVCEKHPILQTPEGRASIMDIEALWQHVKPIEKPKNAAPRPLAEEKTWAELEKRGDFED